MLEVITETNSRRLQKAFNELGISPDNIINIVVNNGTFFLFYKIE